MDAVINELQSKLAIATAQQRRLQVELDAAYVARHQTVVDAMRAEIQRTPDAHALLEWVDAHLWDGSAEQARGALAQLVSAYFTAIGPYADKAKGA